MADEAAKLGMGEGTTFVVSGPDLFGMIHAAAAQAAYADREAGGNSVIAYADGVKRWFEANSGWVPEHVLGADLIPGIARAIHDAERKEPPLAGKADWSELTPIAIEQYYSEARAVLDHLQEDAK